MAQTSHKIPQLHSLEELQREKQLMREKVLLHEQKLKVHYENISHKITPALKIANFLSGNKVWPDIILKVILPAIAGNIIPGRNKNLLHTMMDYGVDKSIKFIAEKDPLEYIKTFIQKISQKKKAPDENKEE